ncbi:MAG: insulinase family protein [Acidobacteria bacterium]|nr:insulinase family protein [Acidobacteriota bacterium]
MVTLDSPAPLVEIKVMVKAGAAADPAGHEGLANLTGRLLIEGGFGDPKNPVTKDKLAEITRPWGGGAYPTVRVSKEVTVFSMTVPKEVLARYVEQVLRPLFTRPLFASAELDRVRAETLQTLRSNLRFEQIELVGLVALDNYIHHGTGYAHPDLGTEKGLEAVTAEAVRCFYATHYKPGNTVVGLSTSDPAVVQPVEAALAGIGQLEAEAFSARPAERPAPAKGREVIIVALPNAISTGIHAGFPLPLTRKDKDYWPLYIANIWFGTHRDGFSHLYQVIREERGYNYGDYSYIEHFEARPFALFPPTNTPRRYQYFSLWIRPVQHDYAHHILKAMTWELEHFIRTGLSEEECALAKNKARVLYLSFAETTNRLLGYRLDDDFYGLNPGYLGDYLARVEAVSCADVNAAIKKYLQAENLKYVIVTDDDVAPKLAEEIAAGGVAWGKSPADYQIDVKEEGGRKLYEVPESRLETLRRDAVWAHYPLDIPKQRIRIVPAEKMFETADLPR